MDATSAAAGQRSASQEVIDGRRAEDNVAIAVAVPGIENRISSKEVGGAVEQSMRRRRVPGRDGGSELKAESELSPEEIQEMLLRPREEEEERATAIGVALGLVILFVLVSFAYSYVMIFRIIFK
jgi:hypothetical protein